MILSSQNPGNFLLANTFVYISLSNIRFQVPDYQNLQKFQNRIVSNLIYYQTNYALSAMAIFGLITFMNPFKMSVGILTMTLVFGLLYYLDASQVQVKKVKKDHPTLIMLGTFLAAYFFIYLVSNNGIINDVFLMWEIKIYEWVLGTHTHTFIMQTVQ